MRVTITPNDIAGWLLRYSPGYSGGLRGVTRTVTLEFDDRSGDLVDMEPSGWDEGLDASMVSSIVQDAERGRVGMQVSQVRRNPESLRSHYMAPGYESVRVVAAWESADRSVRVELLHGLMGQPLYKVVGPTFASRTFQQMSDEAAISAAEEMMRDGFGGRVMQPLRRVASGKGPKYNAEAVDQAIASSRRAGRGISGREARAIHGLLKGWRKNPADNRERFIEQLTLEYRRLFETPDYAFSARVTTPEHLAVKMTDGLLAGTANKDGEGIKRTCKVLGIPYTYAGIKTYLASGSSVARNPRLTLARAQEMARATGCVLRKVAETGEYRVSLLGGDEASAYYTTDLEDAVETARRMSAVRVNGSGPAITSGSYATIVIGKGPRARTVRVKVLGFRDKVRGETHQRAGAKYVVFVEQEGNYRMGVTNRAGITPLSGP